ncbi:MAG: ATPase [Desulfuromonadales bacterium C00003096]|nr:MAG: ATPase [Desulfuromonadales bacterium C00003096]
MTDMLQTIFHRLLASLDIETKRYLYPSFKLDNRLIGLSGPRGVGKTTMLLQFIRETQDSYSVIYFSADNIYFSSNSLFDYVRQLYETEEIKLFFIDEAHKYKGWTQELKNIYDSFPDVTVVFSGSSSMDLIKGTYDLSRRGIMHHLHGLSFREYLNFSTGSNHPAVEFETLIAKRRQLAAEFAAIPRLKGHFQEYLKQGYYPFVFESGGGYYEKLGNVIEKTVHEDIASYYSLKTVNLHYFKLILHYLCTTPPGRINPHNLGKSLALDSKTALHYLKILQETGLVRLIYSDKKGSALIRKPAKVFVDNTSLLYMINETLGQKVNIGTVRELFFINMVQNSGKKLFYSSDGGDFCCQEIVFEIGGRGKGSQQIQNISDRQAFLVKDDTLHASAQTIPLWLFGFLY